MLQELVDRNQQSFRDEWEKTKQLENFNSAKLDKDAQLIKWGTVYMEARDYLTNPGKFVQDVLTGDGFVAESVRGLAETAWNAVGPSNVNLDGTPKQSAEEAKKQIEFRENLLALASNSRWAMPEGFKVTDLGEIP